MLKKGFAALLLLIVFGVLTIGSFTLAYKAKKNLGGDIVDKSPEATRYQSTTPILTPVKKQESNQTQPTSVTNKYTNTGTTKPTLTTTVPTTTVTPTLTRTPSSTPTPDPTDKNKRGKPTSSAPSTGG